MVVVGGGGGVPRAHLPRAVVAHGTGKQTASRCVPRPDTPSASCVCLSWPYLCQSAQGLLLRKAVTQKAAAQTKISQLMPR